jgi:AP-3 complex subunit delta-1
VKYVALLAFNRIVVTHPFLVAQQEDVILECIDSEDITIRIKALDLVQGMVSSDNLVSIVSRLMRQLKASSAALNQQGNGAESHDLETDSSDETSADSKRLSKTQEALPPLPDDYTTDVIGRILRMCSQNNYANLVDFDWYIDVLTQLVRIAPVPRARDLDSDISAPTARVGVDISERIGNELRNVAVKVRAIRPAAVRAAELVISRLSSEISSSHPVVPGALKPIAYVVGEYAFELYSPDDALRHLLGLVSRIENPEVLATCLQAILKLFANVAGDDQTSWTPERKSTLSLLMARVIHVLEPFASHPNLEVQERAVEFIELLKLTAEAAAGQSPSTDELQQDAPLLLTQAIPSLFTGWELNSVAAGTQHNVPIPEGLDLDEPIHPNLNNLLAQADSLMLPAQGDDEFEVYYNQKLPPTSISSGPAIERLADAPDEIPGSYQQVGEESYLDADIIARRKAERMERNRDDPFYIGGSTRSGGTSTPIHNILQKENGPDLDIDLIPIMQLDLEKLSVSSGGGTAAATTAERRPKPRQQQQQQRIIVAADETLSGVSSRPATPRNYDSENNSDSFAKAKAARKLKQSLLQVDSSHLNNLSLLDTGDRPDDEQQRREEAEMAQAMREVQRLRLEMQRANERIQVAQGVPAEGIVVKKKKKTVKKAKGEEDNGEEGVGVKAKKKKKKVAAGEGEGEGSSQADAAPVVKAKKKKPKRIVQLDGDDAAAGQSQ